MNDYETVIIFNTEANYNKMIEKLKKLIQEVKKIEDIGDKKLFYEVRGQMQGHHIIIYWSGTAETLQESEKFLHNLIKNNIVLKFMTIKEDFYK